MGLSLLLQEKSYSKFLLTKCVEYGILHRPDVPVDWSIVERSGKTPNSP